MVKKLLLLISVIFLCGCSIVGGKNHSIEDILAMHRIYTRLGEENELDEPMSGTFYILAKKNDLKKLEDIKLLANESTIKKTNYSEDFNIPSKTGAYFTYGKIEFEDLEKIKIDGDLPDSLKSNQIVIMVEENTQ
ncbi:hypothetical protein [Facklamia sp. 7083-14-GEN3]|uniref:hypothetical protein n=1 Tax=Facklamia sp. 7083-14-GEN3 TaxID=2973478 RepID=UPI00215BBDDF|nr:hypothetical protein [Facklamia sp. 7083-14-GEN3]MCR8969609.1 hypothetical protein [Facklamia sp. 7083-14-GEN3]